jgi:hypothetical protein
VKVAANPLIYDSLGYDWKSRFAGKRAHADEQCELNAPYGQTAWPRSIPAIYLRHMLLTSDRHDLPQRPDMFYELFAAAGGWRAS